MHPIPEYSNLCVSFHGKVYTWLDSQEALILGNISQCKKVALAGTNENTLFFIGQGDFVIQISRDDFASLVYYKPSPTSRMPCIYKPPLQLPFFWMHATDDELHAAVKAYFDHKADGAAPPSAAQIALLADYLDHHIHAPCWIRENAEDFAKIVQEAREQVKNIKTVADIDRHINLCLDAAIDPF
jgi:hypothetical protein